MERKQGSHQYDDAFRAQAVALVIDQKMPVSAAAKQVGVSYETLRKLVHESGRTREDDESKSEKQRISETEPEHIDTHHAARVLCVEETSCIGDIPTAWQVDGACTQDLHGEQPYVRLATDHACVA